MRPGFWLSTFLRKRVSPVLYLSPAAYTKTEVGSSACSISFGNNGSLSVVADEAVADPFWLTNGTPSLYELRVTPTAGTFSSGTVNSWISLGTSRTYEVVRNTPGAKSCTATYEIRLASDPGTILKSASIIIQAFADSGA